MSRMIGLLQVAEDHAQEAAQGGAEVSGGLSLEELPGFIEHHIADGRTIEAFGFHLPTDVIHLPSFELFGATIDLTPTRHLVFMLLAAFLCIGIFVPMARAARHRDATRAPSGFANAMEALIVYFRDQVVRSNIGRGADGYTPFILTIFFFILFMNLLGLTPFGITATANLSVTAVLAIIAFMATEIAGFRALGAAGYARTIFFIPPGLPGFMKPVMLVFLAPVEFLGKLTKPFALAIRLFANMVGGHTLVLVVMGLIFVYQSPFVAGGSVVVASTLMILELFVAFLQAYIFTMLTAVFIGLIRHAH
ncbi:MAG: F0F1 ATP synthase subunit A [Longimicrobiales bacterium]|nr:F0F1 ATP synthase subunit A [Longimicrobiales bacterium]